MNVNLSSRHTREIPRYVIVAIAQIVSARQCDETVGTKLEHADNVPPHSLVRQPLQNSRKTPSQRRRQ
jgi:ribosome-binding protein aMBF1 (putative translation factor)